MITSQFVRDSLLTLRRAAVRPAILSVFLGGLAIAGSTRALAHDPVSNVVGHVQTMLQFVYDNTGATDAQKARLAALVQQANADLAPIQTSMRKSHMQMFSLLTADNIDRAAIEAARAAQMSATEQESKRSTQFITDVAETLTPVQRKALADHAQQHGG